MKKDIISSKLKEIKNYVKDVAHGDSPFNALYNVRNDLIKEVTSGRITYPRKEGLASIIRRLDESIGTEIPSYYLGTPEQMEKMIKEEQRRDRLHEETRGLFDLINKPYEVQDTESVIQGRRETQDIDGIVMGGYYHKRPETAVRKGNSDADVLGGNPEDSIL